jgi:hypothetical protein
MLGQNLQLNSLVPPYSVPNAHLMICNPGPRERPFVLLMPGRSWEHLPHACHLVVLAGVPCRMAPQAV